MNIENRKIRLVAQIATLLDAQGVSQSELARRMQERGWNHSQMTISRMLDHKRTIGAIEHEDLLACLGVEDLATDSAIELAELRAFKTAVTGAVLRLS